MLIIKNLKKNKNIKIIINIDKIEDMSQDQEIFKKMQEACSIAAATLDYIEPFVKSGISTLYLNDLCHDFILKHNARPAALGYKGFPKSVCTSVNHQICHGIPNANQVLKSGDIINIDVVVEKDGYHGDTGRMYCIEPVSIEAQKLVNVTYEAMFEAIKIVKDGVCVTQIGDIIEKYIRQYGFSSVREFCGHGIGTKMHMDPQVPFYSNSRMYFTLRKGMFFTIEPMINEGMPYMKILKDGWTAVTKDMSLSAQWEHTIYVEENGYQIMTLSQKEKKMLNI